MDFREMSLAEFGEALASNAPTPGGGSASALSGALAAALVAMVAGLTTGEKFPDRTERMRKVAGDADGLRVELLALADEDAAAFDEVMAAFRMPKQTPEQQAARSQAIQQGYRTAIGPPMQVCLRSLRILELALQVAEEGNESAVSDAGVAALLAAAALDGAALNVQINLGSIRDEAFRAGQSGQLEDTRSKGLALRDRTLAVVRAKLD